MRLRTLPANCDSLNPKSAVFYSSGRASLEASYMYALFARMYGDQQPARQLEHVPREHVGRVAASHRRAGRHRDARRFR